MSQFQQPQVRTPGLSLPTAPTPRVSQLVGVLLGEARAGMAADQTRARAVESAARTGVQTVQAMDAARRQTAAVYRQTESNIAAHQERQRMEHTQIDAMNVLSSSNADNPEWLHSQATTHYRNATTAGEKRVWFGVLEEANKRRERAGISQEQHEARARKANWELANQTSRLQIDRLRGRLETDHDLRESLIGDGGDIHDRLLEFTLGQLGESIPALQDIRRSDPNFEFRSQLRDDLVLSISQHIAPLGNSLIKEFQQQRDQESLSNLTHTLSAGVDNLVTNGKNLSAAGAVDEFVNNFEESIRLTSAPIGNSTKQQLLNNYLMDTAQQLANPDDNLDVHMGGEIKQSLVERFPQHADAINTAYQQTLEKTISRRVQHEIQDIQQKLRSADPTLTRHEMAQMMINDEEYQSLHAAIREEVMIPFDKEELEPWESAIATTIDDQLLRHERHLQSQFQAEDKTWRSTMEAMSGQHASQDADLFRYSLTNIIQSGNRNMDDTHSQLLQHNANQRWNRVSDLAALVGNNDVISSTPPSLEDTRVDGKIIPGLLSRADSMQQQLESFGVIGPGQALPENLTDAQRNTLPPELQQDFDQLWEDTTIMDTLVLSNIHQTSELPKELTKRTAEGMARGQIEDWRRAATFIRWAPKPVRTEFIDKITESSPQLGRLMASHIEATARPGVNVDAETAMTSFLEKARRFAEDGTAGDTLAREVGNTHEFVSPERALKRDTEALVITSEMLELNAHGTEGAGFFVSSGRMIARASERGLRVFTFPGQALTGVGGAPFGELFIQPGQEERRFTEEEIKLNMADIFGERGMNDFLDAVSINYHGQGFSQDQDGIAEAVAYTLSTMREQGYDVVRHPDGKPSMIFAGTDPYIRSLITSDDRPLNVTTDLVQTPASVVVDLIKQNETIKQQAGSRLTREQRANLDMVGAGLENQRRRVESAMTHATNSDLPVTNGKELALAMLHERDENLRSILAERVKLPGRVISDEWRDDIYLDVNTRHPDWDQSAQRGVFPIAVVIPNRDDPDAPAQRIPVDNIGWNPRFRSEELRRQQLPRPIDPVVGTIRRSRDPRLGQVPSPLQSAGLDSPL